MTITDSGSYEATSDTTLTASVSASDGDLVIATVAVRSEFTTAAGWTLLYDSGVFGGNGNSQRVIVCTQKVDTGRKVSFTATQSVSGRIYINLVSISGVPGLSVIAGSEIVTTDSECTLPDKPPGGFRLWVGSNNFGGSGYAVDMEPDDLDLMVSLPVSKSPRLFTCVDLGSGADTGRSAFFRNGSTPTGGTSIFVGFSIAAYKPNGDAVFTVDIPQTVRSITSTAISWMEDTPGGTSITVSTRLTGGTYAECSNGGDICGIPKGSDLSGEKLLIKVELSTDTPSVTPVLSKLSICIRDESDKAAVVLVLPEGNTTSVQNAAGDVTVAYAGGNLLGQGGAVAAFTETFTPEGLVPKPDQNDAEHIEIGSIEAVGTLMRVYYSEAQTTEHVEITGIEAVGTLTHIDDI